MHYRRIPTKTPRKPVFVDGDITAHANELLKWARLNLRPGELAWRTAVRIAETTANDFLERNQQEEMHFVLDVRDEILRMHDQPVEPRVTFDEPVEAPGDYLDAEVSDVASFFGDFETEDASGDRPWLYVFRERYASLWPIERRVLLVGTGLAGTAVIAAVSAVTNLVIS